MPRPPRREQGLRVPKSWRWPRPEQCVSGTPTDRGRDEVVLTLTLSGGGRSEHAGECDESFSLLWRQAGQHASQFVCAFAGPACAVFCAGRPTRRASLRLFAATLVSPWGYLNSRILRKRGGYGCFCFWVLRFAAVCVHVLRRIRRRFLDSR
jgi:hypothetical protein